MYMYIPTVFFILQVLVCAALFKLSPQYPCSYDHVGNTSNTRLRDLYRNGGGGGGGDDGWGSHLSHNYYNYY